MVEMTDEKQNAEPVNTTVAAVPFADLLYFESSTGKQHLVNARDAYMARNRAYSRDEATVEVTSMCGGASIEVPVTDDLHTAEGLTHLADEVDPETFNDNPALMNHPYRVLDNLCASCRTSWESVFSGNGDYQTVRYNIGDGSWE